MHTTTSRTSVGLQSSFPAIDFLHDHNEHKRVAQVYYILLDGHGDDDDDSYSNSFCFMELAKTIIIQFLHFLEPLLSLPFAELVESTTDPYSYALMTRQRAAGCTWSQLGHDTTTAL